VALTKVRKKKFATYWCYVLSALRGNITVNGRESKEILGFFFQANNENEINEKLGL